MFRRVVRSPLAIVVAFYVCAVAFVWTGVLDVLVPDGVINCWSMSASVATWTITAYVIVRLILLFRKSRQAFAALAIGVVAALVIAEVGIRLFHPGGAMFEFRLWHSPSFHHVTPPSRVMYHGFDHAAHEPILVRTNADGLRTDYTRETFKQHAIRLAVLGDSFTFGLFNRQEAANPQVLESVLRGRLQRDDLAVLNAGTVSYSPFIGQFVVDELLREYDPTVIVYILDASDFGDDWEYARMAHLDGGPRFPETMVGSVFRGGESWADHSALMQRLNTPISFFRAFLLHPIAMASSERNPMIIHGLEIDGVRQRDRFFIYRYPVEKTRVYFERTLGYISAMAETARGMGAKFVLVVAPRYHHWNPNEAPRNWESYAYSNHEPYQYAYLEFFDDQRAKVVYPILNLLPLFQEHAKEGPYVFHFDAHWNASGHRLVANGIADFLVSENLVP